MSGYTFWHGVTILDAAGVPISPASPGVAQGSTTAGQTGTLVQGAVTTASPTYVTAQTSPLSLTTSGLLRSAIYTAAGTAFAADVSGNFLARIVTTALGGHTIGRVMSAATTNATSLKASSGNLYGIHLHNSGAATVFFKLYNKASAPTVGTDTPVTTVSIAAGARVDIDNVQGSAFATGIAYAITNLVADSDTTAVLLNQVTGHLLYQ